MSEWKCPECGSEYDDWVEGVLSSDFECCTHLLPVDGCDCYKCTESEYDEEGNIKNNMEYHTYGQECEVCGKERTEYKDLGRKGRFVCPDQREH
jgi:hypothetical protein